MNKKVIFITLMIAICALPAYAIVQAPQKTNGVPFDQLWIAALDLQNQIKNIQLQPGPVGPQGPQGAKGETGTCTCDSNSPAYQELLLRVQTLEKLVGVECIDDQTRTCYSGDSSTENVGACRAGTQTCTNSKWGVCIGQVLPASETCNDIDDNCDGSTDNGDLCNVGNGRGSCIAGECTNYVCNANYGSCDNQWFNGCETPLLTDIFNCGACDNACPTSANSVSTCTAGNCGRICNSGFKNCDNNDANGCEINANSDINNCGACGNSCSSLPNANAYCAAGACGIGACLMGYSNCDNNIANGCEANVMNSTSNCGACGHACFPGYGCFAGACAPTSCAAIHALNPAYPTGIYSVNPGNGTIQVCCDMTSLGGGHQCAATTPGCDCV